MDSFLFCEEYYVFVPNWAVLCTFAGHRIKIYKVLTREKKTFIPKLSEIDKNRNLKTDIRLNQTTIPETETCNLMDKKIEKSKMDRKNEINLNLKCRYLSKAINMKS